MKSASMITAAALMSAMGMQSAALAGAIISNDANDFQNYAGTTLGVPFAGTGQSGNATTIDVDWDSQDFFSGPGPGTFTVPNDWWSWSGMSVEQSLDVDFGTTTGAAGTYNLGDPGLRMATAQGGFQFGQFTWDTNVLRFSMLVSGLQEGDPLFGGGLVGNAFDDGSPVNEIVFSPFGTGIDGSYDVITIEGSFDEIRLTPEFFGFRDMTLHAISWEVPAPGAAGLLGIAGLVACRRRR